MFKACGLCLPRCHYENPNHNLLTIYMVAKNPELGIIIKLPGKVYLAGPYKGAHL